MVSHISTIKILSNTSSLFATGDQSYEKKTLLFIILVSVIVPVY